MSKDEVWIQFRIWRWSTSKIHITVDFLSKIYEVNSHKLL